MEKGDILGHEFMGEVVEVGRGVKNLKVGDRVVVPFPDRLRQLRARASAELYSLCENSNPNAWMAEKLLGPLAVRAASATRTCSAASRAGRPSTRACRSPTSGRSRCPTHLTDEQVLFLSDIFPTGYMGAEMCDIQPRRRGRGVGLRARSASSRSRARCCSAPSASSPSIASTTACEMAREKARRDRRHQLRGGRRATRRCGS